MKVICKNKDRCKDKETCTGSKPHEDGNCCVCILSLYKGCIEVKEENNKGEIK